MNQPWTIYLHSIFSVGHFSIFVFVFSAFHQKDQFRPENIYLFIFSQKSIRELTLISFSSSSAARIWRAILPSKLAAIRRLATTTEVSGRSAKNYGFTPKLVSLSLPGSMSKSYLCSLATIAAFFLAWSELSVSCRTRNEPQPPFSRASLH